MDQTNLFRDKHISFGPGAIKILGILAILTVNGDRETDRGNPGERFEYLRGRETVMTCS
jgi:hypothetical protein